MNKLNLYVNYENLTDKECRLLLGFMLSNVDVRFVEYMEFYEFVKAKFPKVVEAHDKEYE